LIVVIFDFDGTLVDTYDVVIESYNKIAPIFGVSRITDRDTLRNYSFSEFVKRYKIAPYKVFPLILTMRFLINREKRKQRFSVLPDVKEMLFKLKNEGFILSIVSTNSFSFIDSVLKGEGMKNLFSFVKTSPFLSRKWKILKTLSKDFEKVYYVGDEGRDVVAARKAGVVSVAVTWGFNSEKHLASFNPDFIVKTPKEILKLV